MMRIAPGVFVFCLFLISGCGAYSLPNCDDPIVIDLATQLFRKNIYQSPIAEELIDIKQSSVMFQNIDTVKDGGDIKECSANSLAQIKLSPGGNRAVAREDIFATAFLKAARLPHPIRYVLRSTDEKKFVIEIYNAPPIQ